MSLFDVKTLFQSKSRLRELSDDLELAKESQNNTLSEINSFQDIIFFEELSWESKKCFYRLKNIEITPGSKKMMQHMVKSILIEYYGPAAAQLQLSLK